MATVLYIQASPRAKRSKSIQVADAFVNAYTLLHPGDTIDKINLFEAVLPAFDGPAVSAKFKIPHGQPADSQERQSWDQVEAVIGHFKAADKYVLAVPMWNFTIPYRLKQYIDLIVQPNYTFRVGANGYEGLVKGKPLAAVYARGGAYPKGTPGEAYDQQIRYIEQIFSFIGFSNICNIIVEPTLNQGEKEADKAVAVAIDNANKLARSF